MSRPGLLCLFACSLATTLWADELTELPRDAVRRIGSVAFVHVEPILQLKYIDSGKRIAAAGSRSVRVWETKTGKTTYSGTSEFYSKPAIPYALFVERLSPQTSTLTARVADLLLGKEVSKVSLDFNTLSYALSADGKLLAGTQPDRSLALLDPATGRTLASLPPTPAAEFGGSLDLQFSPDARLLVVGRPLGKFQLFPIQNGPAFGAELPSIDHRGYARLVFPHGSGVVATAGFDRRLVLWDVATGKPTREITHGNVSIMAAAFTSDDQEVATSGADFFVRTWEVATGKVRQEFKVETFAQGLAYSPDNKQLVVSDGAAVRFFDVKTGQESPVEPANMLRSGVVALALAPDNQRMAVANVRGAVTLFDLNDSSPPRTLVEATGPVPFGIFTSPRFLAFGRGNRSLVSGSTSARPTVNVWDLTTFQRVGLQQQANAVGTVSIHPKQKRIISGSNDQSICYWDETGMMALQIPADRERNPRVLTGSPDGAFILTATRREIQAWSVPDGQLVFSVEHGSQGIFALAFTADGRHFAAAGFDRSLRLWNVEKRSVVQEWTTPKGIHTSFTSLAFSPTQDVLAVGSTNGKVYLLKPGTDSVIGEYSGHLGAVTCVEWRVDGQQIVSGGADGTVLFWKLKP